MNRPLHRDHRYHTGARHGYVRVRSDNRGSTCFCCPSTERVRFIEFVSPRPGDTVWLRICDGCLAEFAVKYAVLRAEEDKE